jgi:hypothetical protein
MKPFSHNRKCSKFELGCRFEGAVEFWETEEQLEPLTPERANSSRLLDFELSPQFPFKLQCTSCSPSHTLGIPQTHFSKLQPISLSFDSPPSMKNSFSSTHIDSTIKQEIFAENSDSNDFRSSFFAIQSSAENVDIKPGSDPRFANSFALSIVGVTGASAFTLLCDH